MTENLEPEPDDLREKILKHIQRSGYPFEAKIAHAFLNSPIDYDTIDILVRDPDDGPVQVVSELSPRISVQCGTPYLDPVEKKPRELDVRVLVRLKIRDVELQVYFFVQCKNTNRVWIFCHYGFEAVPTVLGKFSNDGIEFVRERTSDVLVRFPDPVLAVDTREVCGVAKVMTTKEKDDFKKDEIWEASITAINATRYTRDILKQSLKPESLKKLMIFVPMVATGNRVFQVDLSADPQEAKEVDLTYYSQQTIAEEVPTHEHFLIPIITEASLPRVMSGIVLNAAKFLGGYFAW
jgi:hypothetical protein